ncbi:MAG: MogA/MoaB family molybdenum cofactor biosynthesis protein [Clostridia bacterium]|nr:MogA/MoaB family molybdenum cofactor biosynthesis protein [Clostridia bacterium]
MIRVAILTASDKGARGEREDKSAAVIREMLDGLGEVVAYAVVPDEQQLLAAKLREFCDRDRVDLVLTTGGTGFGPRDVTPEATREVIEREVPGLPEAMRAASLKITPQAMLSRAVAGIRGQTLIVNLPGSAKGVRENLAAILPALPHGMAILKGEAGECGQP